MNEHAEHNHHSDSHRHEMPASGRALDGVALSATLHCLTGCAIGEVLGMIIGTALGFSDLGTIVLAVALAFFFGYALTSLPLLRAGLALSAVVPIALASDTFSIATMEVVDNAIMLIVPGAMEAGVGDILFWGALSFALVVAGMVAFPVNRWLIKRGKGHTAVHNTGIHGGPPVRAVGVAVALMAVFGTVVLVSEGLDDDGGGHGGHGDSAQEASMSAAPHGEEMDGHGDESAIDPVRGLTASDAGMTLRLDRSQLDRGRRTRLAFTIESDNGTAVREFEVEHEKRLHLIVVRRDMEGFQHLHPRMDENGRWSTPITIEAAGPYRVFADFKRHGSNHTLAGDVEVPGGYNEQTYPVETQSATTDTGYEVDLKSDDAYAGEDAELEFAVTRGGEQVAVEPYLGADGHLVALREEDLAYLHVHPIEDEHGDDRHTRPGGIHFETEFPSAARYTLFLQFKHGGRVHTAQFGTDVTQ
jgi:hypothetical protein